MSLAVSSYVPPESWADLVPYETSARPTFTGTIREPSPEAQSPAPDYHPTPTLAEQRAEIYGPDPCARPIPQLPPASGLLGPGAYSFSEALSWRAPICKTFARADRFKPIIKDDPPPYTTSRAFLGSGQSSPSDAPSGSAIGVKGLMRNPRIQLGRATSVPSLPTIRDAYTCAAVGAWMVSGSAAKLQKTAAQMAAEAAQQAQQGRGRRGGLPPEGEILQRRPGAKISIFSPGKDPRTEVVFTPVGTRKGGKLYLTPPPRAPGSTPSRMWGGGEPVPLFVGASSGTGGPEARWERLCLLSEQEQRDEAIRSHFYDDFYDDEF